MIRRWSAGVLVGLLAWPMAAASLSFDLPLAAKQTSERINPTDSYDLPVAGFADGTVPSEHAEGRVERRTWRIDAASATSLQILAPLRDQLVQAGYEIVFECRDQTCGGFDFRFGTEIVPAPDMHVDIRDFRFVAARRGPGEVASLLVSKSRSAAYVQTISVDPTGVPQEQLSGVGATKTPLQTSPETAIGRPDPAAITTLLARRLLSDGHIVLADLAFAPGGSKLQERAYATLRQLAGFLETHPNFTIVLVGHTDFVGPLSSNIQLSKRRAQAVRALMIKSYGANPKRVQAEGNGYLSPITTNLTPAGRDANRRVEAILLK